MLDASHLKRGSGRHTAEMGLRGSVSRSERFSRVEATLSRKRRSGAILGVIWGSASQFLVGLCMLGAVCAVVVRFDLVQEVVAVFELVHAKIGHGSYAFWRWDS